VQKLSRRSQTVPDGFPCPDPERECARSVTIVTVLRAATSILDMQYVECTQPSLSDIALRP
jgi:hypothetical protein